MLNTRVVVLRLGLIAALVGISASGLDAATAASAGPAPAAAEVAASAFDASSWDDAAIGDVDPAVFGLALRAAERAIDHGDAVNPATLTVIDFSRRSTQKRM